MSDKEDEMTMGEDRAVENQVDLPADEELVGIVR